MKTTTVIGIISDTHGLLRPEAVSALAGSDRILHAGDIGKPQILDALSEIAPVVAIRGNVDTWATELPDERTLEVAGRRLHLLHDIKRLAFEPAARGIDVVVAGHSHQPLIRRDDGVLYLNPGSAGPRRFALPVAVARLVVSAQGVQAEIIRLLEGQVPRGGGVAPAGIQPRR